MRPAEHERQDWVLVIILLVIGFICVLAAGQWASRFSLHWRLDADMRSRLDPNSDFLTRRADGVVEPVDASILTQPSWIGVFLTPGASFLTGTPFPVIARTPSPVPTSFSSATITTTPIVMGSPTNTLVYILPTRTPISKPPATSTSVPNQVSTSTVNPATPTVTQTATTTSTATGTLTPTATGTASATPTFTATSTATSMPTFTYTPIPIPTDPVPPAIGTTPDGTAYTLPAGGTLTLGINLSANGDSGFDLVYYEFPAGSGIWLDWVIIQISDGYNWYTIFNWGDNFEDANTSLYPYLLSNPLVPPEPDQRDIPSSALYNGTGVAINIDGIVPAGAYSYIRFIAPTGDADNQLEIDAIEILP